MNSNNLFSNTISSGTLSTLIRDNAEALYVSEGNHNQYDTIDKIRHDWMRFETEHPDTSIKVWQDSWQAFVQHSKACNPAYAKLNSANAMPNCQSLRELADQHFRTSDKNILSKIDSLRQAEIARISALTEITVSDVQNLDRNTRFFAAQTLFVKCTVDTRNYLLADEHPHVRATAEMAKMRLPS